jgi:mRNA interferase RelE/StbE
MGSYEIQWTHSAEQDLRKIHRRQIPRIVRAIESLANDPFPSRYRKLRGAERLYRIRIGDYRVIYQVDAEAKTMIIYYIRHRREAYRRL